uniref:Uncharacterized protein n=1 Tax=viral metagenome TaxID=1070528 RepID=A0A6M3JHB8_9ZZZZ
MKSTIKAWAIKTDDPENDNYIGIYWFMGETVLWQEGCRIALWTTKKNARACLPDVRRGYPEATIKRVTVTVEDV